MRNLVIVVLCVFSKSILAQKHYLGLGAGISSFEPPVYINYQFNYKLLCAKTKFAVLPMGRYADAWSILNDYYIGIKSNTDKRNTFALNVGVSLFKPNGDGYEIKTQANPIVNFEYAVRLKKQGRLFLDVDLSSYVYSVYYHGGGKPSRNETKTYMNIQIGYCFLLHKNSKASK